MRPMVLVLVLFLYFMTSSSIEIVVDKNDIICNSPDCIATSERLLKNMNLSVNPCDNFYQFACGGFVSKFQIPADKSGWNMFDEVGEEVNLQGRKLLEDEPLADDFESYQLARDYYKSCMDGEKREELGIKPLLGKLKEFGGWPVLEGKEWQQEDSFKWWEWNYKIKRAGFSATALISLSIPVDSKNTSLRAVTLGQASLGLSREYLTKGFEDTKVQHYYKYMVDTALLLGAESESALIELKESLFFEISLANITVPKEERLNASVLHNPTTLGELPILEGLPPSWVDYVQTLFEEANKVTIGEDEKIIVSNLEYLYNISNLLKNTKPRTLANYWAWRTVQSSMSYLNNAALDIIQTYVKATDGVLEIPPRWKRCTNDIGFNKKVGFNSLGLIAGSMYAKNFVDPKTKKALLGMTSYLKKAFKEDMLEKLDWMDEDTKKNALEKLRSMNQFIAYEDEYLDKNIVDGLHKDIKISPTDFFENYLNLNKYWKNFNLNSLREQVNARSWLEHTDISVADVTYKESINTFELKAGILQSVFYNPNIPRYMNFGSIGAGIGNVITHGFYDKSKGVNEKGELENWSKTITEKNFREKAQCIIDLYGNFTDSQVGLHLNGSANQRENIADIGGLKAAYKGYLLWTTDNPKEPNIVGLSYTPKQLFWVSYAQTHCAKYQDEKLKEQIVTWAQTPSHFRVLGSVSNLEEFATDFNCPSGSNMNPKTRCSVW